MKRPEVMKMSRDPSRPLLEQLPESIEWQSLSLSPLFEAGSLETAVFASRDSWSLRVDSLKELGRRDSIGCETLVRRQAAHSIWIVACP